MAKSAPHPVDLHIGKRLRQRREALGRSQIAIATAIGISCHQIQKYENGKNRTSGSRLYELSIVLDVSVAQFFEGIAGQPAIGRRNRLLLSAPPGSNHGLFSIADGSP